MYQEDPRVRKKTFKNKWETEVKPLFGELKTMTGAQIVCMAFLPGVGFSFASSFSRILSLSCLSLLPSHSLILLGRYALLPLAEHLTLARQHPQPLTHGHLRSSASHSVSPSLVCTCCHYCACVHDMRDGMLGPAGHRQASLLLICSRIGRL